MPTNSFNFSLTLVRARPYFVGVMLVFLVACSSAPVKKESVEEGLAVHAQQKPQLSDIDKSLYLKGLDLISRAKHKEASEIFSSLLEKQPNLAGAVVNLGVIAQAQNNVLEARKLYSQALEINPEHTQALIQLASLEQAEGRFKKSETLLLRAYKRKPNHPLVNYNLGVLYELYLREYGQAIKYYKTYIANSNADDTKMVEMWIKMLERK